MFTSSSSRGISLLAVVIMIGVLGVSLTITRILLHQQTNVHRESETRKEMKEIYGAIMGNPETRTFGYVGDMGRLPDNLTELADKMGQPDFVGTGNSNGIKWGWNGPYINAGRNTESYKKDAWGNDYAIVGVNQIRSNGADGTAETPDDIVFPPKPLDSFTGFLEIKVPKGGVLCSLSDVNEIVVYYGEEGIEKSKSLKTDFNLSSVEGEGFYTTDPIPLHSGIHSVKVSHSIQDEKSTHSQIVFANVPVFADSTHSQIAGTLPHTGIYLHPLFQHPPIAGDGQGVQRIIEVSIVNATGCGVGEGVSYDISQIDIAEIGGVGTLYLSEISFNGEVVFVENTGVPISNDIENPTSITLSETYRLQSGKSLNELKFLSALSPDTSFVLIYHYADTVEPGILRNSTVSFTPQLL